MLILLIYFIGKRFYALSEEHNENKWLYAILGVVVYYAAGFFLGGLIAVLDLFVFNWEIDWDNNYGMNLLIGLPSGLLATWGFYSLLKKKWESKVVVSNVDIEDIGKPIE